MMGPHLTATDHRAKPPSVPVKSMMSIPEVEPAFCKPMSFVFPFPMIVPREFSVCASSKGGADDSKHSRGLGFAQKWHKMKRRVKDRTLAPTCRVRMCIKSQEVSPSIKEELE